MCTINKYLRIALLFTATFGFAVSSFGQSSEDSVAEVLPQPRVLIEKYIDAIGGEQSIRAHSTKTISGKLLIKAMGIEGNLNVVAATPNKIKTTIELGQFGQSISGYDGAVGWSMDPMAGNMILEGEALKQMIARADFYGNDLHLGKNAAKLETVQIVTVEDGEQYKVLLVDANGEESFLYFSKETGLLRGIDKMELGPLGKAPTQIRMDNYVEADGVKTAHKISSSQNGVESIIELDSVSYSALSENAFELPAEIQSQLNK
ncbi:MAG: hypothetical protein K9J12_18295 [Melioribacteraceae bacterium]|nr:hypothetical protein [Melioribacteraceae bacterium]MCF8263385.1 hypothetical protein [Melioribacteraceae bacterium]MCF8430871.1 hypothetical protein [Melioribacteraceae bacterium]